MFRRKMHLTSLHIRKELIFQTVSLKPNNNGIPKRRNRKASAFCHDAF
jgi:hypothetical protein